MKRFTACLSQRYHIDFSVKCPEEDARQNYARNEHETIKLGA